MRKKKPWKFAGSVAASLFIALASTHSFYPLVLVVPMALKFVIEDKEPEKAVFGVVSTFFFMFWLAYLGYLSTNSWNFLEHTFGFV